MEATNDFFSNSACYLVTQSKQSLLAFFRFFWRREPRLNLSFSVKYMKTQGKKDF